VAVILQNVLRLDQPEMFQRLFLCLSDVAAYQGLEALHRAAATSGAESHADFGHLLDPGRPIDLLCGRPGERRHSHERAGRQHAIRQFQRCGQARMLNEAHMSDHQRGMALRVLISRMRHDGCGGRAGRVELLVGIDDEPVRPVRRIVLLGG
jgi:hypothetical protein